MLVDEVGRRLRARRAELGRTLASVAIEAGMSVPYVANLERGRGNPTLGVLESLADTLDLPLAALLDDATPGRQPKPMPAGLRTLATSRRFRADVRELAASTGLEPADIRARLLRTLAAIDDNAPGPLAELDWHRALDALFLAYRKS